MIRLIDFLLTRQRGVRAAFYGLAAAVVVWSLTVDTSHAHTWAERYLPGFWSLFGLLSAIVLIFVARWLAGAGIAQEEDYYDN
ncbi:hypothetical protein [Desulfofustis limnaeus]|uniref:Uncharacterized protein n=1 Tax=Desulfofustis limnaeus TaxID=2740163 RepID=A0ABM7W714_9BACT|nr:hypothetical protein [Desulfofustis limnaeus]BDD86757.1 hypothetical protein DPPLL_11220 [Desulfofustis limnaeus]